MRTALALLALVVFAGACGSDAPAEVDASGLVLSPGLAITNEVIVEDTQLDVSVFVPDGFVEGDTAPVLLAFAGGSQDLDGVTFSMVNIYVTEAARRGWVVVSPAAPDGVRYFDGSERFVPGLIDWIEAWVEPEGGGLHLGGVSNGGLSAFRIAGESPDEFLSLTVYPGAPRTNTDRDALDELTEIPVTLLVGSLDDGWVEGAERTADRLTELGGRVELRIFENEGHILSDFFAGPGLFDIFDGARP